MPRYYYAWTQLDDDSFGNCIFDKQRVGEMYIAACHRSEDAEKLVALLNAADEKPKPSFGIFD